MKIKLSKDNIIIALGTYSLIAYALKRYFISPSLSLWDIFHYTGGVAGIVVVISIIYTWLFKRKGMVKAGEMQYSGRLAKVKPEHEEKVRVGDATVKIECEPQIMPMYGRKKAKVVDIKVVDGLYKGQRITTNLEFLSLLEVKSYTHPLKAKKIR
jgi:hypothetical protein